MDPSPTDATWLLVCSAIALLLQAGAICLLLGMLRGKHATRVPATQGTANGDDVRGAESPHASDESPHNHGRRRHTVLDSVDQHVCILDSAGRIIETNQAWEDFANELGAGSEVSVGASFAALLRSGSVYGDNDPDGVAESVSQVLSGRSTAFEGEYAVLVEGAERSLEVRVAPLASHDCGAFVVTQRDRTEERRAQRLYLQEKEKAETLACALETSQTTLDLAIDSGKLGFWKWDVTSGYFELSDDWVQRLGYEQDSRAANIDAFRRLLHDEERVFWTESDAASLSAEEPYDRQFRLCRQDGTYRWVQALGRATSVRENGAPECLAGILIDIDARKTAELRDIGMAKIIEDSFNEVYVCDRRSMKFIEVNRGARENLGYSRTELLEMCPLDITPSQVSAKTTHLIESLMSGEVDNIEFETIHQRRDGDTYPVMINVSTGRLLDRDVLVAVAADLTQFRQLENQLAEARRLESIGQLAAGIAHEMNTPLQFVGNNIQFLKDCSQAYTDVLDSYEQSLSLEADSQPWKERFQAVRDTMAKTRFERVREEAPKAITDSLDGIDRVLEIVRAMKEFSHPGVHGKSPTDLNNALTCTATITRNRWKYAAQLELDLDPGLPPVECEVGAINQVFVNLIVNAADAILDRHEKESDAPAGMIVARSYLMGDSAVFEVEDNGGGMTAEVQRKAFDPFFTTKEVGKGTGQGLSLSHAIVVQKHGGSLTIKSAPGEGAIMRVVLPVQAPKPNVEAASHTAETVVV